MVYKLEIGMEIDYVRKDENGNIVRQTFIVKSIPKDNTDKVIVTDKVTNKKKKLSRDILRHCERHKQDKTKRDSAIKIALKVLRDKNIPIHIDRLIEMIFEYGYELPRGGKTFKNTISTSLNNECARKKARIKKVGSATYAVITWEKK